MLCFLYCSRFKIFDVICKPRFKIFFCKTKVYFGTFICVIFNISSVKYIWSLKEYQMSRSRWSIVEKVYGRTKINFCTLCLAEKLYLIEHFNDNRLLNKRNEFISGCGHQVKLLLKSF